MTKVIQSGTFSIMRTDATAHKCGWLSNCIKANIYFRAFRSRKVFLRNTVPFRFRGGGGRVRRHGAEDDQRVGGASNHPRRQPTDHQHTGTYLSFSDSLRLSVSLSFRLSFSSSPCLSASWSLCLFVSLSLRLSFSSSLCLFVSPPLRLAVSSSLCLFVSMSLRLTWYLSLIFSFLFYRNFPKCRTQIRI